MKKIAFCALCISISALFGCSNEAGSAAMSSDSLVRTSVQLDESELSQAVGSSFSRKYDLDDGHGITFRDGEGPVFSIEHRANRTNIAWEVYSSADGSFDAMNAENALWAKKALSHALGEAHAQEVLASIKNQQPTKLDAFGHEVRVMPGSMQNLVTVHNRK